MGGAGRVTSLEELLAVAFESGKAVVAGWVRLRKSGSNLFWKNNGAQTHLSTPLPVEDEVLADELVEDEVLVGDVRPRHPRAVLQRVRHQGVASGTRSI